MYNNRSRKKYNLKSVFKILFAYIVILLCFVDCKMCVYIFSSLFRRYVAIMCVKPCVCVLPMHTRIIFLYKHFFSAIQRETETERAKKSRNENKFDSTTSVATVTEKRARCGRAPIGIEKWYRLISNTLRAYVKHRSMIVSSLLFVCCLFLLFC